MRTLLGVLAPVRAVVASLLLPTWHANRLYSADDITVILNITADVADGARADATLLLCAFANEACNSFALEYSSYYRHHDLDDIVYVRIGTRSGRHDVSYPKCVHIGRFASMEEGRQDSVVRWNTVIANCARTGLMACLEGISRRGAAKRKRASVQRGEEQCRQQRLLVTVQEARSYDKQSTILHYILDDQARKMEMEATSNGLFMLRKLQNNLLLVAMGTKKC